MCIAVSSNVNLSPIDRKVITQDNKIKDNSSVTDNVLDLSDKNNLVNELNGQDIQKLEYVKISQGVYVNLSDPNQKQLLLNQLKSKLINSEGKLNEKFSAASFQENTGISLSFNDQITVTNPLKSENSDKSVQFNFPREADIKSVLKDYNFISTFKNPNSDKSAYIKAEKALETKITDIDKQIAALDPSSPDKAKLEYLKTLYTSTKDIYSSLTKPHSKESFNNFLKEVKEASEVLNGVKTKLPQKDIADNHQQLSKMNEVISDFQMIGMAYPSLGGKSSNASHKLNEFTAQTFERLAEITGDSKIAKRERKGETKDISGAIQTFNNDITDMKTFIDRLSKLSADLNSGKFDGNRDAYLAAVKAVAPTGKKGVSGSFSGSISDLGEALYNSRQAKLQLDQAAKNQQNAANQANQANSKLDGAEASVASGNGNVKASTSQTYSGKYAAADKNLRQAESMRDEAQKLVAESKTLAGGAGNDLAKANKNLSTARQLISNSNALLAKVEGGDYGVDLKPITGNAKKENSAQTSRMAEIQKTVADTQNQLNAIKSRTQNVQQSIESLNTDIGAAQQFLDKTKEEQLKKIRESTNGNFLAAQNWSIGTTGLTGIDANRAINEDYSNLDQEFSNFMNFEGDDFVASWVTFGKFASREAGTQIQGLETSLEALNTIFLTIDGNTQNDVRATNAIIGVMDSDPMVKQSILTSATSMGIDIKNKSSTEIVKELVTQSLALDGSGPKKIYTVITDLNKLHTALVKGNTEIHANVAPAYKIFLQAERAGQDGIEALKLAGYGNVIPGETFVSSKSKDPQGLVLAVFQDYKKAKELENQAKQADSSGKPQEAARFRKERNDVMYNGNLKLGIQEQVAILQQPAIFGDPRVANSIKAVTGTMTLQDIRNSDGSYRSNPLQPEGQDTGWADPNARLGVREAKTPLEIKNAIKFTNEKGETKLYVPSGTTDEMIKNGQLTKGADGTISSYFLDNNNNKKLLTTNPKPIETKFVGNVQGKVTFADRVVDNMPGATVIPVVGKFVFSTLPAQIVKNFTEEPKKP